MQEMTTDWLEYRDMGILPMRITGVTPVDFADYCEGRMPSRRMGETPMPQLNK